MTSKVHLGIRGRDWRMDCSCVFTFSAKTEDVIFPRNKLFYCKNLFILQFRELSGKYIWGLPLITITALRILKHCKYEFFHSYTRVTKTVLYLHWGSINGGLGILSVKIKVT